MKRTLKSLTGVTLLEIMLVLAIAALIVVMSIRYYTQANASEDSNIILDELQNMTAAEENLAIGKGSYSGLSATAIATIAGTNNVTTPYGSSITFTGGSSTTYTVTVPGLPAAVCANINAKLSANSKFTSNGCSGTGSSTTLTYIYNSQS